MTAHRSVLDAISRRDHRLMRRVNRWRAPHWIRIWAICATRGGDGWLWYAMTAAILCFGGAHRFEAAGAALSAAGTGVVLFMLIKSRTSRRRPCAIAPHAWATLLPPDQFSFPSGHTITAFAFAVPFALFYPSLMGGLFFCAFSIAISRVLLGMHFLSDVIAGAAIGTILGYTAYLIYS